jgi:hypothetical protein
MTYERAVRRETHLRGFITEHDFAQAEEAFPGIATFYEQSPRKPTTFLELVWTFEISRETDRARSADHTTGAQAVVANLTRRDASRAGSSK